MTLDILRCNSNLIKGEDLKWCNGEGIKDYKKNRKLLGPEWRYYNSLDLTYNLNSYGYRAKEFNELALVYTINTQFHRNMKNLQALLV